MRRTLLWVGDAACPSGFARATHEVLDVLRHSWNIYVLGINYRGDPHRYPYPIYSAAVGGDAFGVGRIVWMCDLIKQETGDIPDVIVLQNDPWNIPQYIEQLQKFNEYRNIPVIGNIAVDGKNCRGTYLNGLALAVFWTEFGLNEARLGGHTGPATVIPLGVDLKVYYPIDKQEARKRLGIRDEVLDWFIVGNVNRNQPRKRLDLTIEYFAEWTKRYGVVDSFLWLHVAPTGDTDGIDCQQYAAYHKATLAFVQPPAHYGLDESVMRDTYNIFDVCLNTSQGEGFGLTTFEAMACGVPQILPRWAAHEELCKDAALMVSCTSTIATNLHINSIGGVMDKEEAIVALQSLYEHKSCRIMRSEAGLKLVRQDRFRWENIGRSFGEVIDKTVASRPGRY